MEPRVRESCISIAKPISIEVRNQIVDMRQKNLKTVHKSALKVEKYTIKSKKVWFTWVMPVDRDMLNHI